MAILADIGVDWRDKNLIKELYVNQKDFLKVDETDRYLMYLALSYLTKCDFLAPLKSVIDRVTAVSVREIHDEGVWQTTTDGVQCLLLFTMPSLFQFRNI